MVRMFPVVAACVCLVAVGVAASTETVAITSGQAGFYWDGDLTSATISSSDSQFMTEYRGAPQPRTGSDGSVDFSSAIPFTNGGNHPLVQTFHGQTFSGAWLA